VPVRKALAAGLCAALALADASGSRAADLVIHNARVTTLDPARPHAQALAVSGARIAAVGADEEILRAHGAGARRIDAGGRRLIPGLIDSHIHAIRGGLSFSHEARLEGARSIEDAMARVRAAAARTPAQDWILIGGGWTPEQFAQGRRPSAAEFEAAAPGRLLYAQLFYRAAYVSPHGRAALGLDPQAPPPGLSFERDESGAPNGWITGGVEAIAALWDRLPKPDAQAARASLRAFFSELNAYGVTGVVDPGGHNLAPQDYAPLHALRAADEMSLRVSFFMSAPEAGSEEAFFARLAAERGGRGDDVWLRWLGFGERVTFGMYNVAAPRAQDVADFARVAELAARNGLSLTAHWNSQRNLASLLEAMEPLARRYDLARLRWSVAHLHDAEPEAIARLHALGLGWLTQNALHFAAPAFLRALPAAQRAAAPPLASALAMGARVGAGTDATRVMSYNPFVALQWMIDGRTVEGAATRAPGELLTREQALRLWTQGSAWFAFADDDAGVIAPGRLADLAILTDDYFEAPAERIGAIRAWLTMVGGRVVHAPP
jgi:predicted amidohydrolase YtcJ